MKNSILHQLQFVKTLTKSCVVKETVLARLLQPIRFLQGFSLLYFELNMVLAEPFNRGLPKTQRLTRTTGDFFCAIEKKNSTEI
jgi:hypothetical protein